MTAAHPFCRPTRSAERATSPLGRGGPKGRGGFLERTDRQTHPAATRHPSEERIFGCLASSQVVLLLTDHQEFRDTNPHVLTGAIIIDARGTWREKPLIGP